MIRRPSFALVALAFLPAFLPALLAAFLPALLASGCSRERGPQAAPAGGPAAANGAPALPAASVAVEPAHRGSISTYYSATATLEPDKQADVLARVSGIVLEILVEEGDFVRAGQPLLRIEETEYRLRLQQAEAEEAKQRLRFERTEKMRAQNLVSTEEYETVRNDLQAATAARELAALEQSYTTVTAPFAGRITRRAVDRGRTVADGAVLFTLVDTGRLLARVHVPAREFRAIRTDQPVELTTDATEERLQGRIDLVSPVVEPTSGTIKVTVEIHDVPSEVRPGDFAEVRIVTDHRPQALLVGKASVLTEKGERVVYVAADTTAERRVVEVGYQDEEHAEILAGVEEGDRVVVQGQRSLKPGQPLRILDRVDFREPRAASRADSAAQAATGSRAG